MAEQLELLAETNYGAVGMDLTFVDRSDAI